MKCKRCGYCEHFGRSDAQPWPYGPIWISPTTWPATIGYPSTWTISDGTVTAGNPTVTYGTSGYVSTSGGELA